MEKRYLIINIKFEYYPFHAGNDTFTCRLDLAKDYTYTEAEDVIRHLHFSGHYNGNYLKIKDKDIFLRKEKLNKIKELNENI
jgi:hypothetical protein